MRTIIISICLIWFATGAEARLLINEVACASPGGDWVEIACISDERESIDVSRYYVTMYYGDNEPLANSPVTLYSYDRPETPYDDRFAVVHLTEPGQEDETDLTGDSNRNGILDLYCNNYFGSLWNSDCVVAIDTDDEPGNGGIIDFVAYSNRDGSPNETISSYVSSAIRTGAWQSAEGDSIQLCMVDIGPKGLQDYYSISRVGFVDTGCPGDFRITPFQTPGRPNIINDNPGSTRPLFEMERDRLAFIPGHPEFGKGQIHLRVNFCCNIRMRIFTSIGLMIHESPLHRDVFPGPFTYTWDLRGKGKRLCTGLYIGIVEATDGRSKRSEKKFFYLMINNYR